MNTSIRTFLLGFVFLSIASPLASALEFPFALSRSQTQSISPYNLIGQLDFVSGRFRYIGSATVVTPRGVLTAAHNLYDSRGGFSTKVKFFRARAGASFLAKFDARSLKVLSGYTNSTSFARDIGVISFAELLAGGNVASYSTTTSALTQTRLKTAMGYGAEFHSGNRLLLVESERACTEVRPGYFSTRGFYVESGMSGGPVFIYLSSGLLRIAAVVVSGNDVSAGIRAVDAEVDSLIRANLN